MRGPNTLIPCPVPQDETENRKQFHCEECGLCRIGGRDSFFHCPTCGCCYSTSLQVTLQGPQVSGFVHCRTCFCRDSTSLQVTFQGLGSMVLPR